MWKVKVIPISSQCCDERESPQRTWWSRISQHASEAAHGAIWKTKGVALRTFCKGPTRFQGSERMLGSDVGRAQENSAPSLQICSGSLSVKVILTGPLCLSPTSPSQTATHRSIGVLNNQPRQAMSYTALSPPFPDPTSAWASQTWKLALRDVHSDMN